MRNLKNLLLGVILTSLLICSVGGCVGSKTIVLKDSERIERHPTDPDKVCLDAGFLDELFEELGK